MMKLNKRFIVSDGLLIPLLSQPIDINCLNSLCNIKGIIQRPNMLK